MVTRESHSNDNEKCKPKALFYMYTPFGAKLTNNKRVLFI